MVTDDTFKREVMEADRPVLAFFTGDFCGPSRMIADLLALDDPVFDRLKVVEIDVEKCPRNSFELQIKGTPTLMLINEGQPKASRIGTQTEDEFFEWIEAELKKL